MATNLALDPDLLDQQRFAEGLARTSVARPCSMTPPMSLQRFAASCAQKVERHPPACRDRQSLSKSVIQQEGYPLTGALGAQIRACPSADSITRSRSPWGD